MCLQNLQPQPPGQLFGVYSKSNYMGDQMCAGLCERQKRQGGGNESTPEQNQKRLGIRSVEQSF